LAVDEQASTALVEDQGSLVMELRRRSGLTWEKLGELFGVDRRSVHNWASGRPMNAGNRERLGRILAMVRRLPEDSEAVRSWLLSPDANDELPFDLLRDGRYDEVALPPGPPAIPFERPKYTPEALRARAPLPPEVLVGAQQDSVHRDMKGGRPVRSVRVKG
jgi:transcriptional regulator with XRE-family HTH domain